MTSSFVRFLASGGFGSVYKYDSKKGPGVVARKVFNINMERAAKHERLVLTKIGRHDNIVSYKGSGIIPAGFCSELVEGAPFIDFEFVDGPLLWNLCFQDDMAREWISTLPRLCDIIRGLLAAVNHVHSHNYIHLDLKPNNVMVVKAKAGDGFRLKPILIDFGISQQVTDSSELKDHHGTDGYQPPEWWAGVVPTQAYDIWALGVIFYELVYGQRAVIVNETLKQMKNRGKGHDNNNNNSKSVITIENTDTAERKQRLLWQKKYEKGMEKASSEIQLVPRNNNRFPFTVPNDIHALVLHMLGQVAQRPTIKEVLASPLFKNIHEGTYEQQQHAKHRALQKVEELQSEKRHIEKQVSKLEEELKHLKQFYADQAAAVPKLPAKDTVDMAVNTEGEDELTKAKRQCKNFEQILIDNDKQIEDCLVKIDKMGNKLKLERDLRSAQEKEFAKEKATLAEQLQQEKNISEGWVAKFQQAMDKSKKLEIELREAEARHVHELNKVNAVIAELQEQLAAKQIMVQSMAQYSIQPPLQQHQQQPQQEQHEPSLNTSDLLAQALNITGFEQIVTQRAVAAAVEAPKRTINDLVGPAISKRLRTGPNLKHLSMLQYQRVIDAGINSAKLPNEDAAWQALDWAYGVYQNNAEDINNPPNALKEVIVDHSKQGSGQQFTSPFEEWLVQVLQQLSIGNEQLKKRNIFTKLTGRSLNAYVALMKRLKSYAL
jgi:serine/threonine protein kinase